MSIWIDESSKGYEYKHDGILAKSKKLKITAGVNPLKFPKPTAITDPKFRFDFKPTKDTKKIKAAIVDNKKELKQALNSIKDGIIYDGHKQVVYSVQDSKKNLIARNKTGTDLTKDIFGKNIKFIDSDAIIKNDSGSGVDIKKLLNKFDDMEQTIEELKKTNRSLQNTVNSLKSAGGSNKNNSTNKDDVTGLEARLSSLEDFVKIDRAQLPPSNPKDGIGYFIQHNYAGIQSIVDYNEDVYYRNEKRFRRIEKDVMVANDQREIATRVSELSDRVDILEELIKLVT